MKNKIFLSTMLVGSLILFGAGCDNTTENPDDNSDDTVKEEKINFESKDADDETIDNEEEEETSSTEKINDEEENENDEQEENNGLTLSAEALGNGQVKFTWEKSDDVKTDKEKGFILVRSTDENPEHNEKNFWFRQSALNSEAIWKDVPSGTMHFRICALQDEKCAVYSNDVELEVK